MFKSLATPTLQKQFLLPISMGAILVLLIATAYTFKYDLANLKDGAKVEVGELADVLQLVEALDADDIDDGIKELEGYYLQHGQPRLMGLISGARGSMPKLQFGEFSVADNASLIETFVVRPKDLVTVFVKHNNHFVRIASTVKTQGGARTEFTKLRTDSPAYPQLAAGRSYRGIISNFGEFHLSYYKPIVDSTNNVIGALHFGKQIDLDDLSETISHWQYLGTGFAAITDQHKDVIFHSEHVSNALAKQALGDKSGNWVVVSEHVPNWQLTIHMVYSKKAAYQKILSSLYPLLFLVGLLGVAVILIFKNNIRRFVLEPLGGDPATVSALLTKIEQGNLDDDGLKAGDDTIIQHIINMRTHLKDMQLLEKASARNLSISASVFDHAKDGIFIADNQFNVLNINPAFSEITGYSSSQSIHSNLKQIGFDTALTLFNLDTITNITPPEFWTVETNIKCFDDSIIYVKLEIVLAKLEDEKPFYIGLFSDITEAKHQEQRLQYMAFHDPLTDMANRTLFTKLLSERIEKNPAGYKIAICYIDLDNFKQVNDKHGHHVGDQLLINVAQKFSSSVRTNDVVARLGGDEFALLLCDAKSEAEYQRILKRLIAQSQQTIKIDNIDFKINLSIGYTLYPADNAQPDILLRHADQAMYQAKTQGGSRIHLFDAALAKSVESQYQLQEAIISGLQNNQFILNYQPEINLSTGEAIAFEGLIRWQHPTLGLLPPDQFIPAIENSNGIIVLGEWVINEALKQLTIWQADNIVTRVAINISAYHITDANFVARIQQLFKQHPQISYDMLDIEITETSAIEDIETVRQTIEACTQLGITFSIDDFGAGYSSINYLRKLPAKTIKIDKEFIIGMKNNPADLNVIKSIISICEDFGRFSLAEGIENRTQLKKVIEMGCQFGQGFYIAKPMPAKQVPKWLKTKIPFKL